MFKKILVAVDDSEITPDLVSRAIALAKATHAHLKFLTVLYPISVGYPNPIDLTVDGIPSTVSTEAFQRYLDTWKQAQAESLNRLVNWVKQAETAGVEASYEQELGEPSRLICDIAAYWQADVILIGRRGRVGISELLLGSVSNAVMHHASCSVLTIQGHTSRSSPSTVTAEQTATVE
ncbi:MAG: universal stress protein [Cyanobacteria bacterium P01_A01_bin.123]